MNEHFKEFREAVLSGKLQTLQGMSNLENVINSRGIFPRGIAGRWTTALIFSVQQNMLEVFKFLLQVPGIDVNLVDPNCERTALHWAVYNSNEEMIKLLVKIPNIKFEMKDYDGKTAQNLADAKIACITAKLEENKLEATNAEEKIKEVQFYSKRKLKSTLEALELKKNKHQEELFKLDRVIDEVKKLLNNVDPGETLEDAMRDFECPICMDIMKPPKQIWQCDAGHALCGECKNNPSIQNCPTCRKEITSRNRAMESLYQTLF